MRENSLCRFNEIKIKNKKVEINFREKNKRYAEKKEKKSQINYD